MYFLDSKMMQRKYNFESYHQQKYKTQSTYDQCQSHLESEHMTCALLHLTKNYLISPWCVLSYSNTVSGDYGERMLIFLNTPYTDTTQGWHEVNEQSGYYWIWSMHCVYCMQIAESDETARNDYTLNCWCWAMW